MWALIKAKLTGQELIPLVAVEVVASDSRRVLSAKCQVPYVGYFVYSSQQVKKRRQHYHPHFTDEEVEDQRG